MRPRLAIATVAALLAPISGLNGGVAHADTMNYYLGQERNLYGTGSHDWQVNTGLVGNMTTHRMSAQGFTTSYTAGADLTQTTERLFRDGYSVALATGTYTATSIAETVYYLCNGPHGWRGVNSYELWSGGSYDLSGTLYSGLASTAC